MDVVAGANTAGNFGCRSNDRDQVFPGVGDLCLRICLIGLAENLVSFLYEIVLVLYFHSFNIL